MVLTAGAHRPAWAQGEAPAPQPADARPPSPLELHDLRVRLRRLQSIGSTAGRLKAYDVPLASILRVDLEDDLAVAARVAEIDERLEVLAAQHSNLLGVETSSTSTAAAGLDPSVVRASLELRTLTEERAFLKLDRATRLSRLRGDEARRKHRREQAEAKARAQEAAAEGAAAQEAHRRALEEAQEADTESLKRLKGQRAAIAQARADLAERERNLAEQQERRSRTHAENLERIQKLLAQDRPGGEAGAGDDIAARVLFGAASAELTAAVQSFREAIRDLDAGDFLPRVEAGDLTGAENGSVSEREAARELRTALAEFGRSADTFRVRTVEAAFRRASAVADARARILAQVPKSARGSLLGLSEESFEAARLEAQLLALEVRAQPVLQAEKVHRAPAYLKDIAALGMTFWVATKVVMVVVLAVWLRRRGPALRAWFHTRVRSRARSVVWLRRFVFVERNVQAFGPSVIAIVAIHLVYWALGRLGRAVEIDLLFTTVLWVAYYRLLRIWLHAMVVWLARKRRVFIRAELGRKLERSTMLVGRTVLVYGLLQSVAVKILRAGVLFHFARLALLAGVAIVGVVLIFRWRSSIVAAYLKKWPDGLMARDLESSEVRLYHPLLVVVALIRVLVSGAMVFAKQFVFGFEQSRKALAYLFRMQLERKADATAGWSTDLGRLPDPLLTAFTLEPLEGSELRLNHFPGLEKLERDLVAWRERRQKGSFLLRASRGYGKTTWLYHALGRVQGLSATYLALDRSDGTAESFFAQMAQFVGCANGASVEAVTGHLSGGERRIIAVDDVHHLFFRRMDGGRAFDALMGLIEDTGETVFWICAVDNLAWRHIQAARPTRIHFRAELVLPNWPEDRLRALLMLRAASSGVSHAFEDLVVSIESDRPEEALVQASEGYTRLIWDYSDGCPLVALRFWLHSLVPVAPDRVRVRLFKEPDEDQLARIPEEGVFIYAAVANHGSLSPRETSDITGYPEPICEAGLIRGVEEGYLARSQEGGRFELAVDWQRQMVRFLKTRQAL